MTASELRKLKAILIEARLKLAVAESVSTGNLQAAVGSISGASEFFEGGITTYSLKQKVDLLGVDHEHAREVNGVSERVTRELARGVCRRFEADLGVATTGYAEPDEAVGIDEPLAYFAIWRANRTAGDGRIVAEGRVTGQGLSRTAMQRHVAERALAALLEYLEG